ncbi:hypothetical protein ACWGR4_33325 [Embleya sp. NPDC055664]
MINEDERDWIRADLAARRFLHSQGHPRIPVDAGDGHDHGYPVG